MITYKHLWEDFISFDNLYSAAKKTEKGKRWKNTALEFNYNFEENLLRLQEELESGEYIPGAYRHFTIYEPKERVISAAPYKDRVVHHAIINILEPIWESRFYYHNYACRVGKGTHKAVDTCQSYLRKNNYVLKCDIQQYFSSIDHQILKAIIRNKIRDEKLLKLIDLIIDFSPFTYKKFKSTDNWDESPEECGDLITPSFRAGAVNNINRRGVLTPSQSYIPGDNLFTPLERKKGIPIGNLTSQFFANLYLNELDQWLKHSKRIKHYLRYMDDFIVFHNSKKYLHELRTEIKEFLFTVRLNLHPKKQDIFPAKNGVPFLGFHVYTTHRRLKKENVKRFVKRMKTKQKQFSNGEIDLQNIQQSIKAWIGHAGHGNTWKLREKLLYEFVF